MYIQTSKGLLDSLLVISSSRRQCWEDIGLEDAYRLWISGSNACGARSFLCLAIVSYFQPSLSLGPVLGRLRLSQSTAANLPVLLVLRNFFRREGCWAWVSLHFRCQVPETKYKMCLWLLDTQRKKLHNILWLGKLLPTTWWCLAKSDWDHFGGLAFQSCKGPRPNLAHCSIRWINLV